MDRYTMMVAITGMITGTVLLISLGQLLVTRGRRPGEQASPDRLRAIEERLQQMQQSLDAVAIEIERVSEGQRFTTRLLSSREGAAGAEVAALEARRPR
jgi:hypothetical protein